MGKQATEPSGTTLEPETPPQPTPAESPPPPKEDPLKRMTPHEHAVATGNCSTEEENVRIGGRPSERATYSLGHKCASRLHGWPQHEYHEAEPIMLSRAAYEAALKAALAPVTRCVIEGRKGPPMSREEIARHIASKAPNKGELVTDYEPHMAALSKHSPNYPRASA